MNIDIPTPGTVEWKKQLRQALANPNFRVIASPAIYKLHKDDIKGFIREAKLMNSAKLFMQELLKLRLITRRYHERNNL